jgi:hypothetical protein
MMMGQKFHVGLPYFSNQLPLHDMADYSRPVTPETEANGVLTPRTPKNTGLALTEYTANPSPPSESPKSAANQGVPEAFLLPNGYPDVRGSSQQPLYAYLMQI